MGRKLRRSLINASPMLLSAAKAALQILVMHPNSAGDYDEVVDLLHRAIDKAEPVNTAISFTVTPMTADELKRVIENKDGSKRLQETIEKNTRYTKQRAYINLEYDQELLRELYDIIKNPSSSPSFRAFNRMSEQLEEELKKTALQRLAELSF